MLSLDLCVPILIVTLGVVYQLHPYPTDRYTLSHCLVFCDVLSMSKQLWEMPLSQELNVSISNQG